MAVNGSFNTTGYNTSDGERNLLFTWSRQSISAESNYSVISYTLKGGGPSTKWVNVRNIKLTINGETVFTSDMVAIQVDSDTVITTGSFTIPHDVTGNAKLNVYCEAGIYYSAVNCSGSSSWDLDIIPRQANILTAPNFTDEDNPTITYNNPASSSVTTLQACISFDGSSADIAYRNISKTGNSYTFNLTDAERTLLRNNTLSGSNTRIVYFFIKTVIGGNTYYSSSSAKTLTIINANPALSPTAVETNSTYLNLTGSSGRIIKGHNSVKVTANATAKKGATINGYLITNDNNKLTSATGTLTNVESATFKFTATDNRGLSTSKNVTLTMVNYTDLTCGIKANAEVVGETTAKVTFEVFGNYFSGSFGSTSNTLTIKYRYKVEGGNYSGWTTISGATISNGRYSISRSISNLDYSKAYTFQAIVYDKIFTGGIYSQEIVAKATPVFDWSGSDFNFNVPVSINGKTISDFIVEQGVSNGWTYRKWNSGVAECWKIVSLTTQARTAWGVLWKGDNFISRQSYPFSFADKPVENVSLQSGFVSAMVIQADGEEGVNGASASARYTVCRPASTAEGTFYLSFYVIGKYL